MDFTTTTDVPRCVTPSPIRSEHHRAVTAMEQSSPFGYADTPPHPATYNSPSNTQTQRQGWEPTNKRAMPHTPHQDNSESLFDCYPLHPLSVQPWSNERQIPMHNNMQPPLVHTPSPPHEAAWSDARVHGPPLPVTMFSSPCYETVMVPLDMHETATAWMEQSRSHYVVGGAPRCFSSPAVHPDTRPNTPYTWPHQSLSFDSSSSSSLDDAMTTTTGGLSRSFPVYAPTPSSWHNNHRGRYSHDVAYSHSSHAHNLLGGPDSDQRSRMFRLSEGQKNRPHGFGRVLPTSELPRKERSRSQKRKRRPKALILDPKYNSSIASDRTNISTDTAGSSKFECDQCFHTFRRIEHLRRHTKTHSAEQPFECEFAITTTLDDGATEEKRCGKLFQRNDNYVAHFKTHISQSRDGLFFPDFDLPKEDIDGATHVYMMQLARTVHSAVQHDDRKKGARNPRVTWEELLDWLRRIKTRDEADKIIKSLLYMCLKEDNKKRLGKW